MSKPAGLWLQSLQQTVSLPWGQGQTLDAKLRHLQVINTEASCSLLLRPHWVWVHLCLNGFFCPSILPFHDFHFKLSKNVPLPVIAENEETCALHKEDEVLPQSQDA